MNHRERFPINLLLIPALIFGAVFISCQTTLNPFDKTRGLYSIYGAIDLRSDLNHVRVRDLNHLLLRDSTRDLGATVSLVNLDNGIIDVLEDIVVEFESIYTHNFRIPYHVQPGTNYRLLIEGDDGMANADIYTPDFVDVTVTPNPASCSEPIEFKFTPVQNRVDLHPNVTLEFGGTLFTAQLRYTHGLNQQEWISRYDNFGDLIEWVARVNSLCSPFGCPRSCSILSDNLMTIDYVHFSPGFFEQTTNDTTSVAGGAGQFGAFYFGDTLSVVIDTSSAQVPTSFNR